MKVMIILEDPDNGTSTTVRAVFDPPLDKNTEMTPASVLALRILEAIPTLASQDDSD